MMTVTRKRGGEDHRTAALPPPNPRTQTEVQQSYGEDSFYETL